MFYILIWFMLTVGYLVLEEKYYYRFFAILISLFSGLRFFVGRDFESYYNALQSDIPTGFEPGSQLLINITKYLGEPQFFFIVTSFFIVCSFAYIIKKYSIDTFTSTLIFMAIPVFLVFSFSAIRQYLAMSIILLATPYIFQRKLLFFLAAVFIAQLFHSSALITVLLYPLSYLKINRVWSFGILGLSFLLGTILKPVIEYVFPYYMKYTEFESTGAGGGETNLYLFIVIVLFGIFFKKNFIPDTQPANFFYNTFLIGVCIYVAFANYNFIGPRGSLYFTMYLPLLCPFYLQNAEKTDLSIQKRIIAYIILFLLYIISLYIAYWKTGKSSIIPYVFSFE